MWVIITPAWGERHIDLLTGPVFKSIKEALGDRDFRLIVHTEQANRVKSLIPAETYDLKEGSKPYGMMNACMAHGLSLCKKGDFVAFINSDLIVSKEVFNVSEEQFSKGKTLILCPSIRTLIPAEPMDAESLLKFSIENMHYLTEESFWGDECKAGSIYLFKNQDSIVMRCFHLHPFAIVKGKESDLSRTVDYQLINERPLSEIYISQNKEMACSEVSPPEKIGWTLNLTEENLIKWIKAKTTKEHRWAASHKVSIVGDPSKVTSDTVVDRMLSDPRTSE